MWSEDFSLFWESSLGGNPRYFAIGRGVHLSLSVIRFIVVRSESKAWLSSYNLFVPGSPRLLYRWGMAAIG